MKIRKAHSTDRMAIASIYAEVAGKVEGISRRPEEITQTYIFSLLNKSEENCIFLVVENDDMEIIGFGHAEKIGLAVYEHILSNFIIAVLPSERTKGIGKRVFMGFLTYLKESRPDIKRLEMEVSNDTGRVKLFEGVGFISEAIIKDRIRGLDGKLHDQVLMAWENPNFKG